MINKKRTRALVGIVEEEESHTPQPVEEISSAFQHAYLACKTQEIPQHTRELQENLKNTGLI